ncbi:serine hydrolase [Hutsoniella sourekii]
MSIMSQEPVQSQSTDNKLIKYGIPACVLLAVLILGIYWLSKGGASNSQSDSFHFEGAISDSKQTDYSSYYTYQGFKLNPNDFLLLEDLQVSREEILQELRPKPSEAVRETDALEAIEEEGVAQETFPLPWYYYSPQVAVHSPFSVANRIQQVTPEEVNGFAYYQDASGQDYLGYQGQAYTGWYTQAEGGAAYYREGQETERVLSRAELGDSLELARLMRQVLPLVAGVQTNIQRIEELDQPVYTRVTPVAYSIINKSKDQVILSKPPRTRGAALVATTADYFDMPMEVVEEAITLDGQEWVHVNIGYQDLGWIPKDESETDYVYTDYSELEMLDAIEAEVWRHIEEMPARVGVSFINNETMAQVDINNQIFFPASTQKIYVLAELYNQYKTGELSPDQVVYMEPTDPVPGAGVIGGYGVGSAYTLDELVNYVAIYSDNTAANMLIDAVGDGEHINPFVQELGLMDTVVSGKYYNDAYFVTTPHDAARLFALLYNDQVNGAPWDEMLISKFGMNTHSYIKNYVPTYSWNKSGIGGTEQNDVATFVTDYGSYSLAVYTAEPAWRDGVAAQADQLSLAVYQIYVDYQSMMYGNSE